LRIYQRHCADADDEDAAFSCDLEILFDVPALFVYVSGKMVSLENVSANVNKNDRRRQLTFGLQLYNIVWLCVLFPYNPVSSPQDFDTPVTALRFAQTLGAEVDRDCLQNICAPEAIAALPGM
jgi:hypothetical protein